MSSDNTRETKPEQKGAEKPDVMEDLPDAKVTEKDSDHVKGYRVLNFPFETGKPT